MKAFNRPLLVLCAAVSVSLLLYALIFLPVANLLTLHQTPLLDLQKMSAFDPALAPKLGVGFIALFVCYAAGWWAAQRTHTRLAWGIVLAGAFLACLLLLFQYPYDAADVFDYIIDGRIQSYWGGNPFFNIPDEFKADPFLAYAGWVYYPAAYGPLWQMLSAFLTFFTGESVIVNVLSFKVLAGLFMWGTAFLVWRLLRKTAPERAFAGLWLVLWNPLVLYETLGMAHNDMVMVFWITAAAFCLAHRRTTLAVLALMLGALIKFIPLLLVPVAVLIGWQQQVTRGARFRYLVQAGLLSLLVAAACYAPYWQGLETLGAVRRSQMYTTSLPALGFVLLSPLMGEGMAGSLISSLAGTLTFLFAMWEAHNAMHSSQPWRAFAVASLRILLFYLVLACPWYQQWYPLWLVGLAALLPAGSLPSLALSLGALTLSKPLVFAPLILWPQPLLPKLQRELALSLGVMLPAWVFLVWQALRSKWNLFFWNDQ
ncbi:MAG TPA: hypothetical protein PKW33_02135 [Anaerolineaceae bacterium]|nr:hypothetical protein [Anaerolineaceae bacterium]HPN50359.1 hypothetical protein [Anaerolineaceae bacterium]